RGGRLGGCPWRAPPAQAPCGCLFDPRVYHIQWTVTNLPPPASATLGQGAASLPGAALWGPWGCGAPLAWAAPGTPQGQPQYLAPYEYQARAVAPAPTGLPMPSDSLGAPWTRWGPARVVPAAAPCLATLGTPVEGWPQPPTALPTSIPGYEDIEGQSEKINTSGTATPAGAPLGSDIPPGSDVPSGSDVPPSPCAAPHTQALGDIAGDLAVPDAVLLEEALRLLGCSLDTGGASQDGPSSSPVVPGDTGGTGAATPDWDFSPSSLPEELLTLDSCIPELTGQAMVGGDGNGNGSDCPVPFPRGSSPLVGKPGQTGPCRTHGHGPTQKAARSPWDKDRPWGPRGTRTHTTTRPFKASRQSHPSSAPTALSPAAQLCLTDTAK
uniref:Uncharacterized protein n=1 Tax=Aquila chrysaetos chrysaetos TaxID=223781 RepID=A0A663EXI9_AQUCH